MKPTRKTQPHRRKGGRVMENGQTLAAMLRGAGNLGNPQDVKRATVKRARVAMPANGADSDPQLGPAGLPPHSGASGMIGPMLAAVPVRRNVPGGGSLSEDEPGWDPRTMGNGRAGGRGWAAPDADPRKRPRHARRAPYRSRKPSFDQSPYRRA